MRLILGWDVGGTKSAAVIGTPDGSILARAGWASRASRGPEVMLKEFLSRARKLLKRHRGVLAVGVSIGGPLDTRRGVILSPPHLPGWDRVPLRETLERELGLEAVVEHDAAACLEAECLWGGARGATHAAYLTCGTGFGAGILIDGRILRGPDGQTPEVGHIRLAADGPEMFGKRGCSESFCSGEGIGKLAAFMFPKDFPTETDTKRLHDLHAKERGAGILPAGGRAKKEDRGRDGPGTRGQDAHATYAATAVLSESARRTGQLCAVLADIYSPQVILLGSLARYFGAWWVEGVREGFLAEALPNNSGHTQILPAKLGKGLQDLSAIAPCVFGRTTTLKPNGGLRVPL